jgi:hypothetical protein
MTAYNNQQYARMELSAGDEVYFLLTPYDGVTFGQTVASNVLTIASSEIVADNVMVEGQYEPLNVLTNRPVVSWTRHCPRDIIPEFVSVRLGTFPGSSNIYSEVINSSQITWQVPANLLRKGGDYYVSVALGRTAATLGSYKTAHFRITESRWETEVSNSTGWTIQSAFVFSDDAPVYSQDAYQVIRFQDGSRFGEVRIYADRLSFVSSGTTESSTLTMTTSVVNLVIVGKNDTVKVWVNNELVIDGTDEFTQSTTSKLLEVGTVTDSAIGINYQSIFYSTLGAFDPGSTQWTGVSFYTFANFKRNEVKAIEGVRVSGDYVKVVGVNPHDESQGGFVYKISDSLSPVRVSAVNRTFSPINKIVKSPSERYKVFAHGRGGTIFDNYLVGSWNNSMIFDGTDSESPDLSGWDLVENTGEGHMSMEDSGMVIDTTFESTGTVDTIERQ